MIRTSPPYLAASFLRQTVHAPQRVRASRLWNYRDEDSAWKHEMSGVDYPEVDILADKFSQSGMHPTVFTTIAREAFRSTHTWAMENRKRHKKVALRRYFLGTINSIIANENH